MTPLLAQRPRVDRSFERLYKRHAGDVYRYALAVLHNPADAEDVTQTTFLNAYRAIEQGQKPHNAHNWLIAIAHNVCRQRFRQSQRRPSEVAWNEDVSEPLVADDEGPSGDDIRRALAHLAFNQRAALVMRELEGRSYAEIAEVLELSVGAVETLIFRARRALREQLEGALTCGEAELAISKQLDGRLPRAEKGQLRAHLRECAECATFARRQRAQRKALRSLAAIPLPTSLLSLFGGGGTAAGVAVAGKAAAVVAAAALAGGAGYESYNHLAARDAAPRASAPRAPADAHTNTAASGASERPATQVKEPRKAPSVRAKRGGAARTHAAHPRTVARGRAQKRPKDTGRAAATPPGLAKAGDRSRGHGVAKGRAVTKPQAAPRTTKVTRGRGRAAPPAATPTRTKKPAKRGSSAQRGNGGGNGKKAHGPAPRLRLKPPTRTVPTVTAPQLPDGSTVDVVQKSSKLSRKFFRGPASP